MNCMTICQFMMGGGGLTLTEIRTAYRYLTGKDVPVEELVKFGERAWQLQRIINVRDGLDRKDDTLPLKMTVPAMVGPGGEDAPPTTGFSTTTTSSGGGTGTASPPGNAWNPWDSAGSRLSFPEAEDPVPWL